jgi:hypothetical protein
MTEVNYKLFENLPVSSKITKKNIGVISQLIDHDIAEQLLFIIFSYYMKNPDKNNFSAVAKSMDKNPKRGFKLPYDGKVLFTSNDGNLHTHKGAKFVFEKLPQDLQRIIFGYLSTVYNFS